ncbi:cache domain-containing sensor histidine kinase [Shouchella shacheensis]|uniref:cache domain-containing sensor histidine kinase n=1 Tax=Shouchella shacheensis TaxID=1649580 RepID=UPI00073FBB53|nr:sensor histidine kinase [Shouchella shacheensis]
MFKKFKVKTVLFSSFALFIVILFAIVILISYRMIVNEMVAHTTGYQQQTLGLYSKEINNQLRAVEEMSLVSSRDKDLLAFLQGEPDTFDYNRQRSNLHSYLYQVILSMSLVESIDVYMHRPPAYDSQMPIRFLSILDLNNHPENERLNQVDEGWLGHHPKHLDEGNQDVVSYARNIYSANGDIRGVLVMNIPVNQFTALIENDSSHSGNRMLLDSDQQIIASVGSPELTSEHEMKQAVSETEQNSLGEGELEGERGLIVWSGLSDSDWLLVELTPWGELTGGGERMAKVLFGISFFAVICALFTTYFLSGKFTKPILLLMSAMQRYGSKKKVDVPEDYKNEFGQLFKGFQNMTGRIENLHQSLEKQNQLQRKAEISALQANINPHFLYNTLDQLNWMAVARNQEDMSKVLELTGKMLRIGLSNGRSLILIADELAHIQYYMEIQQYRLSGGITHEFEVDEKVKVYYIPKFTLQPLIENAIIHGFHRCEEGEIRVTIEDKEESLLIRVIDNGNGFDPQTIEKGGGGFGINNVEKRIKAFFGDAYGLTIKSRQGIGTTVEIRLAKQKDNQIRGGNFYVENSDY